MWLHTNNKSVLGQFLIETLLLSPFDVKMEGACLSWQDGEDSQGHQQQWRTRPWGSHGSIFLTKRTAICWNIWFNRISCSASQRRSNTASAEQQRRCSVKSSWPQQRTSQFVGLERLGASAAVSSRILTLPTISTHHFTTTPRLVSIKKEQRLDRPVATVTFLESRGSYSVPVSPSHRRGRDSPPWPPRMSVTC